MPLVAHSKLPSYARLADDGQEVLDISRAQHQDIRELHIGVLNMMPDAALEATERQFMRMLGASSHIVQLYVHLFTVPGIARGDAARAHIDNYYLSFEQIKAHGLDGLIITGANVAQPDLLKEPFYPAVCNVVDWAHQHVASVLCSCLASHALWHYQYNLARQPLSAKRWGVFEHRVVLRQHPLVANINTRFHAPHSRYNDVSTQRLQAAGAHVLVESEHNEVMVAVSSDGLSVVYFQGHPEYDTLSLAKEYKREVKRFIARERDSYPASPAHYFSFEAQNLLDTYQQQLLIALSDGSPHPAYPDALLETLLDNTWADTGKAMFSNWLGLVYRTTHLDRQKHRMDELDQKDPLGWLSQTRSSGSGFSRE